LWTSHFRVLAVGYGIGWPAELWTGAIALSAMVGLLIAFLLVLARAENASRLACDAHDVPGLRLGRGRVLSQRGPHAPDGLADALLVLHQGEAHEAVAGGPEADARRDRHLALP
jgi:hypothetical protein